MSPLVKRILSAVVFYGIVAGLFAGLGWLYLEYIWIPQNFSFAFTDHEFWDWMSWLPVVDAEAMKEPTPVRYELSDLRWLGLLCGLPIFIVFVRWTLTDLPLVQHGFNVLVRSLLVIALVGSLLNLQRTDYESHVSTIFVVDVSESVPDEVLEKARKHIQEVYDEKKEQDDLKVVTFSKRPRLVRIPTSGKVPALERHPEDDTEEGPREAAGERQKEAEDATAKDETEGETEDEKAESDGAEKDPTENDLADAEDLEEATIKADSVNQHTNVQAALRLAYGLFPPEHVKRMVLITDGNQTEGDMLGEAYSARTYDVRIYVKHFPIEPEPEVMIRNVVIKDRDALRVGKPFEIEVELFSSYETTADFRVWQGEFKEPENSKTVELNKGETYLTFTSEPFNPGPVTYKIFMRPEGQDHYKGNNVYQERLVIEGKPRILYVEGDTRRSHYLERALEGYGDDKSGQDFIVDVRPPGGMPNSMEDILQFDAVIMSDVPKQSQKGRTYVSTENMRVLEQYVKKHGGGFIAIGGEQAFGLGGFQDTAIERMLPVKFESDLKREHPSLALGLVIDRSGSMDGQKMELAKDAAKKTVEVLGKNDRVMVIAFDGQPYTYVPLQRASNRIQIVEKISRIRAGGGTDIQPALEEAYVSLATVPARIKHVILLTDGQSSYGTIAELVRSMNDEMITVSTVAVGNGADTVLLNMIAENGGGRSYFTNDPYSIPQIFLQETSLITQNAIVEEPFRPRVKKKHQMLGGVNMGGAPDLLGYVTTKAKDGADVLLVNPRQNDPVLATWRYGIGKTTVFTSDVKNRWATAWVGTRTFFPKFWAQVVRTTMRRKDQTFFQMDAELRQGKGHITVDAIDDDDQFINGLYSEVQVTPPEGEPFDVVLHQTAPGLYEGDFELGEFGPYYLEAVHREQNDAGEPGDEVAESRATLSYPYPAEFFYLEPNTDLVDKVAEITGGKPEPETEELFDPEGQKVASQTPLWMWFLWPALFLVMIDVLFRRVRFYGKTSVPWEKVAGKT